MKLQRVCVLAVSGVITACSGGGDGYGSDPAPSPVAVVRATPPVVSNTETLNASFQVSETVQTDTATLSARFNASQ